MQTKYTDADIDKLWDKVSHWQDLSDELAKLVERYFGQDFGEHSPHNCPVINSIVYLKEKLIR